RVTRYFAFGSKAEVSAGWSDFCFAPKSGHPDPRTACLKSARTRHSACLRVQRHLRLELRRRSTRLSVQDDRLAARSRSTRSVTSRAIETEPNTSLSVAPLTIANVISTYSLRPLLCRARVFGELSPSRMIGQMS